MTDRRSTVIGVSVIVAAVAALLFPSLIGITVLSPADQVFARPPFDSVRPPGFMRPSNPALTDVTFDFMPYALETRDQIRAGKLPLWNPYSSAGRPLLAWQQVAPFYPLSLLYYVFPYLGVQAWIVALKLIVAGLGVFMLGRALRLSPLPATMSGLAYALSAYLVFWMEHPHTNSYALFPWLLLATDRVAKRPDLQSGVLVCALVGISWLGGHPPSTAIVLLGTMAYFLFRLTRSHAGSESRGRSQFRSLSVLGVGIAAGTAIGAVMLVPFVEYLGEAYDPDRGGGPPPLQFKSLAMLMVPEYWGRWDKVPLGPLVFSGGTVTYFGVAPLLLAAASLFVRPRSPKAFFAALAAGGLIVAFDTPLAPVATAIRELPVLKSIELSRTIVFIMLGGALLSGFGLNDLMTGRRLERRRMMGVMLLLALAPVGLLLAGSVDVRGPKETLRQLPTIDRQPLRGEVRTGAGVSQTTTRPGAWRPAQRRVEEPAPRQPRAGAARAGLADFVHYAVVVRWLLLAAGVIGIAYLILRRPRYAAWAASALLLITAVDLVTIDYGIHPQVKESRVSVDPLPAGLQYLRDNLGDQRFAAVGMAMTPNLATRFKLRDIGWGSPLHLKRYRGLWTRLGGVMRGGSRGSYARLVPSQDTRVMEATSASYLLVPWTLRRFYPGRIVTGAAGSHVLVENPDALPRAWVAYSWQSSQGFSKALAAVDASTAEGLFRRPVVESAPSGGTAPKPSPSPAQLVEDGTDRVVVKASAQQDGYLILNDLYYPGWEAEVDGKPAPILAANASFRAVPIAAGGHEVSFTYRPASVRLGGLVSLTATVGLVLVGIAVALWPGPHHGGDT